jgi:IS5 family transposase
LLTTAFGTGMMHDFALFKNSALPLQQFTCCMGDSGYKGIDKLHGNSGTSCTPHKKSKHHPLSLEQKQENKELARERIVAEHVIRWLKRFRLLAGPYRNRRKRFGLRFNLIAALYNLHLDL